MMNLQQAQHVPLRVEFSFLEPLHYGEGRKATQYPVDVTVIMKPNAASNNGCGGGNTKEDFDKLLQDMLLLSNQKNSILL
jgi:hypothetical protein